MKSPAASIATRARNWASAGEAFTRDSAARAKLAAGGEAVDPELAAQRRAGGAVALRVDAAEATVLAVARPGDDEVAGRVRRHRGERLATGGVGVSTELASERRAGGAVALR